MGLYTMDNEVMDLAYKNLRKRLYRLPIAKVKLLAEYMVTVISKASESLSEETAVLPMIVSVNLGKGDPVAVPMDSRSYALIEDVLGNRHQCGVKASQDDINGVDPKFDKYKEYVVLMEDGVGQYYDGQIEGHVLVNSKDSIWPSKVPVEMVMSIKHPIRHVKGMRYTIPDTNWVTGKTIVQSEGRLYTLLTPFGDTSVYLRLDDEEIFVSAKD